MWIRIRVRIYGDLEPQDLVFEVRVKERVERRLEFLVTEWEKSAEREIRTPEADATGFQDRRRGPGLAISA